MKDNRQFRACGKASRYLFECFIVCLRFGSNGWIPCTYRVVSSHWFSRRAGRWARVFHTSPGIMSRCDMHAAVHVCALNRVVRGPI